MSAWEDAMSPTERLAEQVFQVTQKNPLIDLAVELERIALQDDYFVSRKLFPNVDYYSSIVLDAIGVETDLQTPLFAMSRIAGWTAQVNEQWSDNRLIRPLDNYIGPMDLTWVPIGARK